jgi:hypothetical protein
MSKQYSLDKYFIKRKENNENNTLTKKRRVENENISTQSNTVSNQLDDSTVNNISIINSITLMVFRLLKNFCLPSRQLNSPSQSKNLDKTLIEGHRWSYFYILF